MRQRNVGRTTQAQLFFWKAGGGVYVTSELLETQPCQKLSPHIFLWPIQNPKPEWPLLLVCRHALEAKQLECSCMVWHFCCSGTFYQRIGRFESMLCSFRLGHFDNISNPDHFQTPEARIPRTRPDRTRHDQIRWFDMITWCQASTLQ